MSAADELRQENARYISEQTGYAAAASAPLLRDEQPAGFRAVCPICGAENEAHQIGATAPAIWCDPYPARGKTCAHGTGLLYYVQNEAPYFLFRPASS